jgi:hypothetical protein
MITSRNNENNNNSKETKYSRQELYKLEAQYLQGSLYVHINNALEHDTYYTELQDYPK